MRVLIAAAGTRGDVQPAFALALALRSAGHGVIFSAPPDFAGWAGELDLEYVPSGESVEEWLRAHADDISGKPFRVLRRLRQVLSDQAPHWFESTFVAAQGVDAIVSANQFASLSVAEKLGIPCYCVVYTPTLLQSAYHAPAVVPWHGLPHWLNSTCFALSNVALGAMMKGPIDAGRAKLDLPAVGSLYRHLFEQAPILLACDTVLHPAPPDWGRFDVTTTGPWFYEDPSPLDAEVEAFLGAGPAPIYIGFGSMVTRDAARVTQAVIAGAGAGGRRLLLSKGWAGIGEGHLPPTAKVVHGPMPHAKLFPRVAAVVHHGGAGTTATALRVGVPQVVVPHLLDQFHNAHRLASLNLAPPGVPAGRLTATRLASAIEATLSLPPWPRQEAAARLRAGEGVARAVALIDEGVRRFH